MHGKKSYIAMRNAFVSVQFAGTGAGKLIAAGRRRAAFTNERVRKISKIFKKKYDWVDFAFAATVPVL